ncbi:MAG: Permease of the drug/metabolite transporter superfamily [Parcubacteria group bacterium GW2011_GWC1_35_8]|uniref:EamA domain-containing protein n=2 Tax=Candidatus Nomuraibacteriota TaxID=1752729 RepID=A0A1F6YS85_9BACT|nr:MAG: Permease of the drug/metabolite transporter superfamily [Parcubacteria group bacterium GW2011_GWC1_35_8]KKP89389.1 MAG: Permease of the drug/metabolite transporter superfamily [Candidatus Nomurabacteria bacterium GW2011_GWC2_35_8]OGJ05618.1 MAG: hypothetical protein A2238_02275 [Candidatus Nomurabacteria bacterium RIFOXYA2_FULL_35_9]OGJ09160.1 MAG: hypothetical protein A2456_02180 [Candidatus Nomurabacteria bacterium RIFOXYC2_FULL_36_19]OGJ14237.1 MAG: hypothetical protein A2554_01755 [
MTLYFFAWTASLLFGLEGIIAKLVNKHSINNVWLFNFIWALFSFLFVIPVAFYFGAGIPLSWNYIFLGSIFFALATVLNTISLSRLDISVFVPLFSFRTAMAVIISSFFIQEILTVHQYFLIAIILIFGIFVSFDEHFSFKSFFNRNILIALTCMFFYVILSIFLKKSIAINDFWTTTLWITLLGQCWLLFTIPLFKKVELAINVKQCLNVAVVAFIGTVGMLAANAAYAKNVSLSTVIISLPLSMIIAFLFSIFAPELLEKHSLKVYAVRFTAAIIMIIAAINL